MPEHRGAAQGNANCALDEQLLRSEMPRHHAVVETAGAGLCPRLPAVARKLLDGAAAETTTWRARACQGAGRPGRQKPPRCHLRHRAKGRIAPQLEANGPPVALEVLVPRLLRPLAPAAQAVGLGTGDG
eukprot:15478493-Alexandrium_andersonii.AAC.1